MEWNNCFLCLVELKSGKRGRKKKVNPKILLRYLLDTPNHVYDNVIKNVLRTMESDNRGIPAHIQFCEQCETTARQISELHLQLEMIQMKLVDNIKSIQNKVIDNSKVYGSNDVTKMCLEVFEDWLNIRENDGNNHAEERETLKNLYEFQTAVYEKQKQGIQIPLVYLHHYALKLKPFLQNQISPPDFIVKKEPEPILDYTNDLMPDSPLFSDDTSVTTCTTSELMSAETPEERKRNQTIQKEENPKGETFLADLEIKVENDGKPCRKRAAATLASERIMKLKKKKVSKESKLLDQTSSKVKFSKVAVTGKARTKLPKEKSATKSRPKSKNGKMKGKMFTTRYCDLCPYTVNRVPPFECHLRSHETDDKKFSCAKCDEVFSVKQLYELHMSLHNGGGGSRFLCEICSKYISPLDNPEHLKTHSDKVFICTHCTFSCISRDRFIDHLFLHSHLNVVCDICSQTQRNRLTYLHHICEVHNAIEKVYCDIGDCKKSYYDSRALLSHKRKHRISKEKVKCELCEAQFNDIFFLKIHERKVHTGERPFVCDQCSEGFISNACLAKHKRKAHRVDMLKCSYCPREFIDLPKLSAHLILHEGRGYPCDKCNKVFVFKHMLKEHQLMHTNEKNYVCEECGKEFTTVQKLRNHKKLHVGDKKYQCTYCPKAFVLSKYLVNHLRIHTGERPYICDACGQAFNQVGSLSTHRKKHTTTNISNSEPAKEIPSTPPSNS